MTELRQESLEMPGADLGPENPLPFFREDTHHRAIRWDLSLPPRQQAHIGWETGFRVLPYRMQDGYTRTVRPRTFRAVVLENEYLAATFLPELGGRLISLVWKPDRRELLFRNPVFQPANLAIRNAWFAGGIEWNVGQFGHTFTTCSPVFAAAIRGLDGEPGLRLYEFERCKGLFWHIDFYLPPDSPALIAFTRIANPSARPTSAYWWTNIAVPEREGTRVLAPATHALTTASTPTGAWGYAPLPHLSRSERRDHTYPLLSPSASEFFFQCDRADLPWEAALDRDGRGLIEASSDRLRYRKLFCWGRHQGGRHWQEFLGAGDPPYAEIQAGLAPTQVHGLPMPPHADWSWVQVFTHFAGDPAKVHGGDWTAAWQSVEVGFKKTITAERLRHMRNAYRKLALRPSAEILQTGSGFGALERARRERQGDEPVPPPLAFPSATVGPEQQKWLRVLDGGPLVPPDASEDPGEWMVQPEWLALLEPTLGAGEGRNWYALLHAGVMYMEAGDRERAASAWRESLRRHPTVWAHRNLAILAQRRGRGNEAAEQYAAGWKLARERNQVTAPLAADYLQMLCALRRWQEAAAVVALLPPAVADADRVAVLRARIALETGDLDTVEALLQRDYAIIREGEADLTNLWFGLWARREAGARNAWRDPEFLREVRRRHPLPRRLDFRSGE